MRTKVRRVYVGYQNQKLSKTLSNIYNQVLFPDADET